MTDLEMISCDTNILLYYLDSSCDAHPKAKSYLDTVWYERNFLIADLVLLELYVLLRNPKVLKHSLSAKEAADCCRVFRTNPAWQVVECTTGVMPEFWTSYAGKLLSAWSAYDVRLGLTLRKAGVKIFATRNVKDFKGLGFDKIVNPID